MLLFDMLSTMERFNPRSREGSDKTFTVNFEDYDGFNPRSREGSDGSGKMKDGRIFKVSIHAPAKGATNRSGIKILTAWQCFNPRSREGSDSKYAQFFIMILAYLHNIITYFLIKTI